MCTLKTKLMHSNIFLGSEQNEMMFIFRKIIFKIYLFENCLAIYTYLN